MFRAPRSDFWAVGIVPRRLDKLSPLDLPTLREQVIWLPDAGEWRYYADPFALRRGDTLHVFVEAFDYRTRPAHLQRLDLHLPTGHWSEPRVVLRRPFHLSYPYVFDWQGEAWMVPESSKAGEIGLYRGSPDLDDWTRVGALLPNLAAVDASLVHHEGLWWMFYGIVGPRHRDRGELHAAFAKQLQGPWTVHPANPIFIQAQRARPGGTPFIGLDGRLVLPLQDCSQTYGGATRLLALTSLSPGEVLAEPLHDLFTGDLVSATHTAGLHTLSACGDFTLLDVKRIDRSRQRQWLDWQRRLRRLVSSRH